MMEKFRVLDLFCGAGGLSEGFLETGVFEFISHIEWEVPMVKTLRNNLIKKWGYTELEAKKAVVHFDIQKTNELLNGVKDINLVKQYSDNSEIFINKGLDGIVAGRDVDVIIGGPPCQAYSIAGRAQDPNSMKDDYRNYLFESFAKVVEHYKPNIFVFENVPGILSARPGDRLVVERIYEAFNAIGYEIRSPKMLKKAIFSSADYEVPQERHRVIIFGIRKDSNLHLEDFYKELERLKSGDKKKTVYDAIGNLPKFKPLKNSIKVGKKNISHKLIGDIVIPLHDARYNNARDLGVFKEWISKNMNNYPNSDKLNFYERVTGRKTNHNKYRNIEWNKPSPTIVSHLYKDGFMFIHPDVEQLRTITVREAALLQTFPMDYEFIGSTAYCFKMIGNAVPVLFAKKIGIAIANVLRQGAK